ncbi:hypothetical protein ACH4SP_28315 [Streptomyces sp. NPDC021093]|uniref:hypothetical protein n=1 Tax=Streptomyces sp. NPDC021093 TaxID=3365112 RepID=UPI00379489C5
MQCHGTPLLAGAHGNADMELSGHLVTGQPRTTAAAHETSGAVEIQRLADGKAVLRLTNLRLTNPRTSDGPALHVRLSDQPVKQDGGGKLDDGTHVDLGVPRRWPRSAGGRRSRRTAFARGSAAKAERDLGLLRPLSHVQRGHACQA